MAGERVNGKWEMGKDEREEASASLFLSPEP
jgi:hypothetical protein